MRTLSIAGQPIGNGNKTLIVAEIGINHNGDVAIAKKLIAAAKEAGCDAVKFQKRTIEIVYTPEELAKPRENPFGPTNGDLKRGLEFGENEYREIDRFCREQGLFWFASPWDEPSVDFLERFGVPCHKVAAASLTDSGLLRKIKATGKPVILSTGMSSAEEIDAAVKIFGPENLLILHCVSLYPAAADKVNLRAMQTLMKKYPAPVGYSGHELDVAISAAAVALGACMIERHFTLDRAMWGSDHKASIVPTEMQAMIDNIRLIEQALGAPEIHCLPEEEPVKAKLRRIKA
ncbi:sialic acid synthase [Planctomycetales bacterium]|nr:sialic acid synthase [Planctomycetales bacterium]GHT06281.1 sialic acid synthase [Planctomycetales bacterium]